MAVKQTELSEVLFTQLYRLQDEKLCGEKLKEEIDRSKESVNVAMALIANGSLVLNACKVSEISSRSLKLPVLLSD
jgi:hypothetical protein